MKKCDNCSKELFGKQRRFCSEHCKNVVTSREYNELHKERLAQKRKEYYDTHPEEISKNKKEYYQKNKDRITEYRKNHHKEHPEIDKAWKQTPKGRMVTYKRGAKTRGLVFELSLEYFNNNWDKNCYYCGDKINGIGIDRKDNDIGYTEENALLCCEMCNKMKLNHTLQDFINQCNKITKNLCQ